MDENNAPPPAMIKNEKGQWIVPDEPPSMATGTGSYRFFQNTPKNKIPIPNLPKAKPKPTKDKKITFRVTNEIYDIYEKLAEQNNTKLSNLMSIVAEDYFRQLEIVYRKAQFLNTCPPEMQKIILNNEKMYPPAYRQFTMAKETYPNAEKLSKYEVLAITRLFEMELKSESEDNNE